METPYFQKNSLYDSGEERNHYHHKKDLDNLLMNNDALSASTPPTASANLSFGEERQLKKEFIARAAIATNNLKLNVCINGFVLLSYILLFYFNWVKVSVISNLDEQVTIAISILKTTIQPGNIEFWNSFLATDKCHVLFKTSVCDDLNRVNTCFVLYMILKGFSVVANLVAMYGGLMLISNNKKYKSQDSEYTALDDMIEGLMDQPVPLVSVQKDYYWR